MNLVLGLIVILITAPVSASEMQPVRPMIHSGDSLGVTVYLAQLQSDGRSYLQSSEADDRPPSLDMGQNPEQEKKYTTPKSPLKAFIYSALIPGTGQLYTGSKLKAVVFLGLEALTWTGQIVYDQKGDDKTAEFEDFADTYWSEDRYSDFISDNWPNSGGDDEEAYDQWGYLVFTHHLPDTKTQQYYEMIGKYDQFVFGWNDVDTLATPATYENHTIAHSDNRLHYENMRHDANNMYDRSTAAMIATMANHLISGIEAALAARSHNKKVDDGNGRLTFRADVARIEDNYFPMLTMKYSF
jgi:hypothetical protein